MTDIFEKMRELLGEEIENMTKSLLEPQQRPTMQQQRDFVEKMQKLEHLKRTLDSTVEHENPSWKQFGPGYHPPTPDEIKATFRPFTASQVASMLGVTTPRTIRRWIGGEVAIPYSSWRLFLIKTGRVCEAVIEYGEVEQ